MRKKANEKKGNKLILLEKTWKFYTDDQISSLVIIDPQYHHHRHHHHHHYYYYYYYYYFITRCVRTRSQSSMESDSQIARTQLKQSILFCRKQN